MHHRRVLGPNFEVINDEWVEPCHADAIDGSPFCYLHHKYANGLCEPPCCTEDLATAPYRMTDREGRVLWVRQTLS